MARQKEHAENGFEDLSSYSSTKEYQKRRQARRRFTPRRLAAMAACMLLMGAGAVMLMLSAHLDGMTTSELTKDPSKLGIHDDTFSAQGVTNVAVFGVDSRNGAFTGPSDLVMVLTADQLHNKVKVSSLLGGSLVSIQGDALNGSPVQTEGALRSAYATGGPELAVRTLNRNFGLDITDYITLNFNGMAAVIDALGGIEVRLTAEELREINVNLQMLAKDVEVLQSAGGEGDFPTVRSTDYIPDASGQVNITSGNYVGGVFHLNGNQTVAYARISSIDSDSVRAERQQVVLSQILETLKVDRSRGISAWVKELLPHLVTSLDVGEAAALGESLSQESAVETFKVPDDYYEQDLREITAADGGTALVYDLDKAAQRLQAFLYEEKAASWAIYGDTGREGERKSALD